VKVKVDPDPRNFPPPLGEGRVGVGHVRYYMPQEGSGKGPTAVGTSEGWQLTGNRRLKSRNKLAPWN
jgi:hypothetical protein